MPDDEKDRILDMIAENQMEDEALERYERREIERKIADELKSVINDTKTDGISPTRVRANIIWKNPMSMPDPVSKDNTVEKVYGKLYRECYEVANSLFNDEAAKQSATATLYIRASKDEPLIQAYLKSLKDEKAEVTKALNKLKEDGIPSLVSVYIWHYTPLISREPKLGQAIRHWVTERGITGYKELDEHVVEYMIRNGHTEPFLAAVGNDEEDEGNEDEQTDVKYEEVI